MLLEKLKEETKYLHNSLESISFSNKIMSKDINIEEYKKLLIINYLFHKNLEDQINHSFKYFEELSEMNFESRLKSKLLEKDLKIIDVNPEEIFKKIDFELKSIYDCFAYLYLAEGSTLGGNIIIKALRDNKSLENVKEFNFYGCYGDSTSQKWKSFCHIVNKNVPEDKYSYVISISKKAFEEYISIFKFIV